MMTRTTMMVAGMVAAAGTMLCGCTAGQWQKLGDRLIDGVTLDIAMGTNGQPSLAIGYSSAVAGEQALYREQRSMQQRLIASATGTTDGSARSLALADDDRLRQMIREMIVAEQFPDQSIRLASSN